MGRVHIRRLTLQAFRAFKERQSTKLLPRTGLVGIRGHVAETGGSSGSGKSSIGLAIAHAFGFCPFPATEQQNWDAALPMQVTLELDTSSGPALLHRGKEFSLSINETLHKGSAKAVEAAIVKMTGLPTDLLEALTYRKQQDRGRFLSMTDAEKKSFLGLLLGTGEVERQIKEAVEKSNKVSAEAQQLSASIEYASGLIKKPERPDLINTGFESQRLAIMELTIGGLNAKVERLTKALEDKLASYPPFVDPQTELAVLKAQLADAHRRQTTLMLRESEEKNALYNSVLAGNENIGSLEKLVARKSEIERRIPVLEAEIIKLEQAKCPTCMRDWEESLQRLEGRQAELKQLLSDKAGLIQAGHTLERMKAERKKKLDEWQLFQLPLLVQMNEVVQNIKLRIAEAEAKGNQARTLYEAQKVAAVAEDQKALQDAKMASTQLQNEINFTSAQVAQAARMNNELISGFENQMATWTATQADLGQKRKALSEKLSLANAEADFAAALKGYLGSLFDEVLAQISAETNELLREIPNTPTITVTFVSEVENVKGVVRQEIKPVIIKNGHQISLKSGISGGQLESVELAVDLSIVKVIGERTGVRPGFMIFDESFSAHCLPVKQACLQVLSKAAQDCLILVIDHATELRDYFTDFIDVENERDVARLVVD